MPKKRLEGVVITDSLEKTIKVQVSTFKVNAKYGKRLRRSKNYLAHDENNNFKVGDSVVIEETKPISKKKTWVVVNKD